MSPSATAVSVSQGFRKPWKKSSHGFGRSTPKGAISTPSREHRAVIVPVLFSRAQENYWQHLVRQLVGCAPALLTADHLLSRYRRFGGRVYGSQETMAAELRVSDRTIRRHLGRLERAGLVTVIRCAPERDPASGRWFRRLSNAYLLRFPSKEQATNRREARRRRRSGEPAPTVPTEAQEGAEGTVVESVGERPLTGLPALTIPSSWTTPAGSSSNTYRTRESSHDPSGSTSTGATAGVAAQAVEKLVSPEPEDELEPKEAFALMRARLSQRHRR